MNNIFILQEDSKDDIIEAMNQYTKDWTLRCARGEEYWVCADCSIGFPEGMPDECEHGYESCTKIIKRDKKLSKQNFSTKD